MELFWPQKKQVKPARPTIARSLKSSNSTEKVVNTATNGEYQWSLTHPKYQEVIVQKDQKVIPVNHKIKLTPSISQFVKEKNQQSKLGTSANPKKRKFIWREDWFVSNPTTKIEESESKPSSNNFNSYRESKEIVKPALPYQRSRNTKFGSRTSTEWVDG